MTRPTRLTWPRSGSANSGSFWWSGFAGRGSGGLAAGAGGCQGFPVKRVRRTVRVSWPCLRGDVNVAADVQPVLGGVVAGEGAWSARREPAVGERIEGGAGWLRQPLHPPPEIA